MPVPTSSMFEEEFSSSSPWLPMVERRAPGEAELKPQGYLDPSWSREAVPTQSQVAAFALKCAEVIPRPRKFKSQVEFQQEHQRHLVKLVSKGTCCLSVTRTQGSTNDTPFPGANGRRDTQGTRHTGSIPHGHWLSSSRNP